MFRLLNPLCPSLFSRYPGWLQFFCCSGSLPLSRHRGWLRFVPLLLALCFFSRCGPGTVAFEAGNCAKDLNKLEEEERLGCLLFLSHKNPRAEKIFVVRFTQKRFYFCQATGTCEEEQVEFEPPQPYPPGDTPFVQIYFPPVPVDSPNPSPAKVAETCNNFLDSMKTTPKCYNPVPEHSHSKDCWYAFRIFYQKNNPNCIIPW